MAETSAGSKRRSNEMRKTIILGSVLVLAGFVAVAQASDHSYLNDNDTTQVQRQASNDERGERHDRYERSDRSRERHGESHKRHGESHGRQHHSRDGDSDDRSHRR
jgi:hypothetical protein